MSDKATEIQASLGSKLDMLCEDAMRLQQVPFLIYELEMAKARMVKLVLAAEQKRMMEQMASQIVTANGNEKLPPPPGQRQ